MLRTFNCGVGMVAVVNEANAGRVIEAFRQAGDTCARIGKLVTGSGDAQGRLSRDAEALTHVPLQMKRVAVLISGRGSNLSAADRGAGRQLQDHPGDFQCRRRGRARHAAAAGIATRVIPHNGKTREAFDAEVDAALRAADAEIVVLAGFMRILSDGFARAWEGKLINIHPRCCPPIAAPGYMSG